MKKRNQRRVKASAFTRCLHEDLQHHAGTDRLATLANGEALTGFHRNGVLQLDRYHGGVTGHYHVNAIRQRQHARHVCGAKEELRLVPFQKRGMPTALLLRQHIHLALEPSMRGNAAGARQNLTSLDFLTLDAAKQYADIFARSTLIDELAKDLDARAGGLDRRPQAHDLDLIIYAHDPTLDGAGDHRAATRDRVHILDAQEERRVDHAIGQRNVSVHIRHQPGDRRYAKLTAAALERQQCAASHDRRRVAGEAVPRQKLAYLHLDQIQQLRIGYQVSLVHEHDHVRHADLAREQN